MLWLALKLRRDTKHDNVRRRNSMRGRRERTGATRLDLRDHRPADRSVIPLFTA